MLFVGLGIGSLHPDLKLPEIVYMLGLAIFVYTVGLSSGPTFVASLKREGLRNNALIVACLTLGGVATWGISRILHLKGSIAAGMFAGSFTNTPALAGALETIKHLAPKKSWNLLLAEPVVGYSIAYPLGVFGVILAIYFAQKIWRIDYAVEAKSLHIFGMSNEPLHSVTILIDKPDIHGLPVHEFNKKYHTRVMFGRIKKNGKR